MKRLAGRIILLWGWRRALVAALAGALAVLGQAPYDFFAVGFISFPVLVWLLDGATVEQPVSFFRRLAPAFAIGWWFGFGYFVAGLWWVGSALLVEADAFAWALPLAVLALPAALAVFYGIATAVARMFWPGNIGRIFALAFGFGLAEWMRSTLLTGFPWIPVGYAAMPVPLLMQSVSVVGVMGMNALAVFVFAAPALLVSDRTARTGLALAALLVSAQVGFGYWELSRAPGETARTLRVRIVQPSTPQDEKWDKDVRDRIFRTMLQLSGQPGAGESGKPELIVWPETSVPFLLTDRPDALVAIGDLLDTGQTLMAGAVRAEAPSGAGDAPRFYNSVVVINDKGEITDAVDKVHLVPFGEYLPFENLLARAGIRKIIQFPMTFSAGTDRHPVATAKGVRASVYICYEIIFPDLVAASRDADLIVNVTNDAWFGDTPGPYQHFRQAQIRAVETGRPVIRAANNGISGYIDEKGRIVDALAIDSIGVLDVTVPFKHASSGFTLSKELTGLLILLTLAFLACGMALRERLRVN